MNQVKHQSEPRSDRIGQLARDIYLALVTSPNTGKTKEFLAEQAIADAAIFYRALDKQKQ